MNLLLTLLSSFHLTSWAVRRVTMAANGKLRKDMGIYFPSFPNPHEGLFPKVKSSDSKDPLTTLGQVLCVGGNVDFGSQEIVAIFPPSPDCNPLPISLLSQGDALCRVPSHESQSQVYSAD